mmetsp:Transcript_51971/g.123727  ORF Transcript_51971/g.123727 Transcript_51971/m.123727 type:complete len:1112 (-) Transcript_51971:305-3640(-)
MSLLAPAEGVACEYKSHATGEWLHAKVVALDDGRGIIQLDVLPGVWLRRDSTRLRDVTSAPSAEAETTQCQEAAKDGDGNGNGNNSSSSTSCGSSDSSSGGSGSRSGGNSKGSVRIKAGCAGEGDAAATVTATGSANGGAASTGVQAARSITFEHGRRSLSPKVSRGSCPSRFVGAADSSPANAGSPSSAQPQPIAGGSVAVRRIEVPAAAGEASTARKAPMLARLHRTSVIMVGSGVATPSAGPPPLPHCASPPLPPHVIAGPPAPVRGNYYARSTSAGPPVRERKHLLQGEADAAGPLKPELSFNRALSPSRPLPRVSTCATVPSRVVAAEAPPVTSSDADATSSDVTAPKKTSADSTVTAGGVGLKAGSGEGPAEGDEVRPYSRPVYIRAPGQPGQATGLSVKVAAAGGGCEASASFQPPHRQVGTDSQQARWTWQDVQDVEATTSTTSSTTTEQRPAALRPAVAAATVAEEEEEEEAAAATTGTRYCFSPSKSNAGSMVIPPSSNGAAGSISVSINRAAGSLNISSCTSPGGRPAAGDLHSSSMLSEGGVTEGKAADNREVAPPATAPAAAAPARLNGVSARGGIQSSVGGPSQLPEGGVSSVPTTTATREVKSSDAAAATTATGAEKPPAPTTSPTAAAAAAAASAAGVAQRPAAATTTTTTAPTGIFALFAAGEKQSASTPTPTSTPAAAGPKSYTPAEPEPQKAAPAAVGRSCVAAEKSAQAAAPEKNAAEKAPAAEKPAATSSAREKSAGPSRAAATAPAPPPAPTPTPAAAEKQAATESSSMPSPSSSGAGQAKAPDGKRRGNIDFKASEVVGYDEEGEPVLVRQVDPETGSSRTIVLNKDGSQAVFGANTVASLLSTTQDNASHWIDNLSMEQMRGLTHEVGQRLVSSSAKYTFHKKRYDKLSEKSHYAYFGLSSDATDKDLDLAYKKMAKQMHPDKNGGTDEAKKKFQEMRAKYEALKERRTLGLDGESSTQAAEHKDAAAPPEGSEEDKEASPDSSPQNKEGGSGGQEGSKEGSGDDGPDDENGGGGGEPRRKEAYEVDEEEEQARKKSSQHRERKTSIEYDPGDRQSLSSTAKEMVEQLRALEGHIKIVEAALRRAGL